MTEGTRTPSAPGTRGAAAGIRRDAKLTSTRQYTTANATRSTEFDEALRFLRALYGNDAQGWCTVFLLPATAPHWIQATDLERIAETGIEAAERGQNVYVPVGLQAERLDTGRGKAATVCALAGLWADIDYRSPAHKADNLPPTESDALTLLAELPLEPTIVVHSGHGLQAWWLFRELLTFGSDAERLAAADLAERWQVTVQAAAARHGWVVDATADLARVLRLPGTVNRKEGCEPAPVRLLDLDDANRYARDDFEPYLVDTPDNRGNGSAPAVGDTIPAGQRNATLTSLAGTMRRRGMGESAIVAALLAVNAAQCQPPLPQAEVKVIAHSVAGYEPAEPPSEPEHCTDLGNARRLVQRHGQNLRYCEALGGWLVWDGRRWAVDATGKAVRKAKDTVRAMYVEAGKEASEERRKALANWALGSESAPRIAAMLELARTEPEVVAEAGDFDADPWLFNCRNGTIDLHTGELRPHNRQDLITKLAPVDFEPNLTDPLFEKYLSDATGGDAEFAAYLQRAAGYTLTGVTDTEDVFLLLGPGNSGKTTLMEAMLHTWGDYCHKASFTTFLARSAPLGEGDPPRADLVQMRGARLVAASEPEKGRRLAASTVKELSGGDQVNARLPYAKQAVTYMPTFKLWLAANRAPVMDDDDSGLWRRLKDLAFTKVVPEEKRDPALKRHLQTGGRAAVLAWAVRGCLAWQQEGLHPPRLVRTATSELRSSFDPLADFFEECCSFAPDVWVSAKALRDAYVAWAKDMKARPISHKEWGARLRERGCEPGQRKDSTGHNRKTWEGVTLQSTLVTDVTDEAVISSNF